MTEFLGLEHHWRKRSLAKPHSMSGILANTTLGEGTLLTSAME